MDIAFDLDGTLVPGPTQAVEAAPWYVRLLTSERLRPGARALLRELAPQHRLWLYTTSLRSRAYLRVWFRLLGVRLTGVVNAEVHDRVVRQGGGVFRTASKYPPAFGIALLVDDSAGVAAEGRRYSFAVVCVPDQNRGWVEAVRAGIAAAS